MSNQAVLDDLNELRCHKLTVEQASRVDTIRNYLKDTNHGQGLGFEIFGVITYKIMLRYVLMMVEIWNKSIKFAVTRLGPFRYHARQRIDRPKDVWPVCASEV